MVQKLLLQGLEEVASKISSLEREKREAVAKVRALEREKAEAVAMAQELAREVSELSNLITLAGERVDEILKAGADDDVPQPQPVNVPAESKGPEHLGESSADSQRERKWRSSKAFRFD